MQFWHNFTIHNIFTYMYWCLAWFYGISTRVGYLMPNLVYTYISDIWFVNILLITFLNESELILFFFEQLNSFKYFYPIWIIPFTINHLFAHS